MKIVLFSALALMLLSCHKDVEQPQATYTTTYDALHATDAYNWAMDYTRRLKSVGNDSVQVHFSYKETSYVNFDVDVYTDYRVDSLSFNSLIGIMAADCYGATGIYVQQWTVFTPGQVIGYPFMWLKN